MKTLLFALVFAIPVSSVLADGSDDRYPDKRLSRSMELYQLETGADSPEVKAQIAEKDKEIAVDQDAMKRSEEEAQKAKDDEANAIAQRDKERDQHQKVMRSMQDEMASTLNEMSKLITKQKAEEGDPATLKARQREALMAARCDGDLQPTAPPPGTVLHDYVFKKGTLEENFARILGDLDFKVIWNAPKYLVEQEFTVKSTDIFAAVESVMQAYNERGVPLEAAVYWKNLIVDVHLGKWDQKIPTGSAMVGDNK